MPRVEPRPSPPHRWSTRQRIGSVEIRAAIDADIQATPCLKGKYNRLPDAFRNYNVPFGTDRGGARYEHCCDSFKRELKTAKRCAVYEEELSRVWPDGNQREPKIARFAEDHGFRLRFYRDIAAYTPFSIKSRASAMKSNLSDAFNH
jgi:hypothetical protein